MVSMVVIFTVWVFDRCDVVFDLQGRFKGKQFLEFLRHSCPLLDDTEVARAFTQRSP